METNKHTNKEKRRAISNLIRETMLSLPTKLGSSAQNPGSRSIESRHNMDYLSSQQIISKAYDRFSSFSAIFLMLPYPSARFLTSMNRRPPDNLST